MTNPMDCFPRLPNGDIDENSPEWQEHCMACVLHAESEDELTEDDIPHIEHALQTHWNQLDDIARAEHALSGSELYKRVQLYNHVLKNYN